MGKRRRRPSSSRPKSAWPLDIDSLSKNSIPRATPAVVTGLVTSYTFKQTDRAALPQPAASPRHDEVDTAGFALASVKITTIATISVATSRDRDEILCAAAVRLSSILSDLERQQHERESAARRKIRNAMGKALARTRRVERTGVSEATRRRYHRRPLTTHRYRRIPRGARTMPEVATPSPPSAPRHELLSKLRACVHSMQSARAARRAVGWFAEAASEAISSFTSSMLMLFSMLKPVGAVVAWVEPSPSPRSPPQSSFLLSPSPISPLPLSPLSVFPRPSSAVPLYPFSPLPIRSSMILPSQLSGLGCVEAGLVAGLVAFLVASLVASLVGWACIAYHGRRTAVGCARRRRGSTQVWARTLASMFVVRDATEDWRSHYLAILPTRHPAASRLQNLALEQASFVTIIANSDASEVVPNSVNMNTDKHGAPPALAPTPAPAQVRNNCMDLGCSHLASNLHVLSRQLVSYRQLQALWYRTTPRAVSVDSS